MTAVAHATNGLFCDTAPLTVSNGQVWAGLFCDVEAAIPPVAGGGGSSAGIGYSHYNQAPDTREYKPKLLLKQAMQEDEEMLLMIKAFVETIQ